MIHTCSNCKREFKVTYEYTLIQYMSTKGLTNVKITECKYCGSPNYLRDERVEVGYDINERDLGDSEE